MKRTIVLFLLGIPLSLCAQVQHVKGIYSGELGGGFSPYGFYVNVGGSYYFSRNRYLKSTLNYEKKQFTQEGGIARIQKSCFIDLPVAFTVASINDLVYINLTAGPSIGIYQEDDIGTFVVPSAFKYGGLIGTEIEVFFTDKLVFLLNANSKYLFGSEFGTTRAYYGAGIKYSF